MAKHAKSQFTGDTIIRFDEVTFEYGHNKHILEEAKLAQASEGDLSDPPHEKKKLKMDKKGNESEEM